MSCRFLCVIISDRGVLGPLTSRENNCVVKASVHKSWAELSGEMLGWEITSPFPATILLCWGASESWMPGLPAAPRRMYCLLPIFHKEESVTIITFSTTTKHSICPCASVTGTQLLKPPDIEKRLPQPRGAEGHGVWNVAGKEEGLAFVI